MKYNEVLNKEYIMKAVHHCVDGAGCADCPYEFAPDCASVEELLCYIKELTEENEKLNERLDREARCQYDLCGQIVNLRDDVKYIKADTVQKMQEKLEERIDQTIQVFDFQISECNAIRQALRGVKNDIYQIAKEVLED